MIADAASLAGRQRDRAPGRGPVTAPGRRSEEMNTRWRRARAVTALVLFHVLPPPAFAADTADSAPIELPPMMVEESITSVPWLYVEAGGTEFLSRCSVGVTRHLVNAWLNQMQLVRALVPPEYLVRMDVPSIFVLYSQDIKHTVSAEIQRELQSRDAGMNRINVAPSMRLTDRDMHGSIAYIDESQFEGYALSVAPGHVRYLMSGRVPALPSWLIEGVERIWRSADFVFEPITLRPIVWVNHGESSGLGRDASFPRAVLTASELFTTDVLRAMEKPHPRRSLVRAATQELFVRWAILSGGAIREAFWKFVDRASQGPVTEEMFEEIFGFDYCELRDRLSDYLPDAVERTKRINPGRLPPLPRYEIERATPNQIARVRGEWERLAIGHVRRRLPQVLEPYIAQARRTLRRAYDAGDRDPRLLATMGLCEIDAGNDEAGREYLELAVAGGVVRPRAYYELARIRYTELRRGAPEEKLFSYTEFAPVLNPLRRALGQSPPLPEVYVLLGDAWSRCEFSPNSAEFEELERGARLFAARPAVVLPIARALARHGKKPEAVTMLHSCAGYATDDDTRSDIARLRAELAVAPVSR